MKSNIIAFLPVCAIVALFAGCKHPEGSPAMEPSSSQRIFKLPYEQVWGATITVITEDLGLEIDEVFSETGIISTDWKRYEKKAGDYQEASRRQTARYSPIVVEYKIIVMVKKSPEGTMVRVRKYQREFKKRWFAVPTDLMVERQILDKIALRLGVTGTTQQ